MPPTDPARVAKDLGRRVAEIRRSAGLTQQQVAERADVSVKYLQRVEAGRENLTIRSLVWLAELLGARVADLFAAPAFREARLGRPARRRPEPERQEGRPRRRKTERRR